MRTKCWWLPLCLVSLIVSGCGTANRYDPTWGKYNLILPGEWQVTNARDIVDSNSEFQWTIFVATKPSTTPDYTDWTTQTVWKQIPEAQAQKQIGHLWSSIPDKHFYFYQLSMTGDVYWADSTGPLQGVATSQTNNQDNKRLVQWMYFPSASMPIVITTKPLQLTSIVTNQNEPSITFTWKPLPHA